MNQVQAYKEAESLVRGLKAEVQKNISYSAAHPGLAHWSENNFKPALAALEDRQSSPVRRLANACSHLQIFGGMGSFSDVGPSLSNTLFESYTQANNFYQDCWSQGIS